MRTKEELNALKKEVEALNKKLTELADEELKQVVGGTFSYGKPPTGKRVDSDSDGCPGHSNYYDTPTSEKENLKCRTCLYYLTISKSCGFGRG